MPRWLRISASLLLVLAASAISVTFYDRSKSGSADERLSSQHEVLGINTGDSVFIGDDLTAEGLWNELFPRSRIRNRGINGQSTSDLLLRIVPLSQGKPARIFLNTGANDAMQKINIEHTLANYRELINLILAFSPNTSIIVSSALPLSEEDAEQILALNEQLKQMAEKHRLKYVDLASAVLNDNGEFLPEMADSRLRLLGPAYTRWQALLQPHLPGY